MQEQHAHTTECKSASCAFVGLAPSAWAHVQVSMILCPCNLQPSTRLVLDPPPPRTPHYLHNLHAPDCATSFLPLVTSFIPINPSSPPPPASFPLYFHNSYPFTLLGRVFPHPLDLRHAAVARATYLLASRLALFTSSTTTWPLSAERRACLSRSASPTRT